MLTVRQAVHAIRPGVLHDLDDAERNLQVALRRVDGCRGTKTERAAQGQVRIAYFARNTARDKVRLITPKGSYYA